MKHIRICTGLLFFLLLLSPPPVVAKTITLLNGDQLSGEIKNENAAQLILHHAVLGDITIPKKQIRPDSADNSNAATETKIKAKKTRSPKAAIETVSKPKRSTEKQPGLFGITFLEGWKRRLALGLKGERGNDVSTELSLAFDTSFKDEEHRFSLNSAYYYETEDHEKDTSKGHINIVRDWLLPDTDWFYYAYFRYEQDSFKSWKNRVSISGGPGYDFYNDKILKLSGRTGLGFSKSWGDENEFDVEGQLGLEWLWKPPKLKNQSLSYQIIVYPILNDLGEYRTWMEGKWRFDLDFYKELGFEFGFEHEYESRKDKSLEDEEYFDLIYFGRIGLDF
jgi:putative salt-induced outer membrane protein YdiY